jgi:hypothetical protein
MKNSTGIRGFSQISLVAASLCPILAACSSMNMEDMAPRPQAVSTSSTAQTPQTTGPGDYPNLNIAVQPAAEQISAEERQQLIDELAAKRGVASGPSGSSPSEAERLRRLARQRQQETLNAIESAQ